MTFEEWYEKEWSEHVDKDLFADEHFMRDCWNAATEAAKSRWVPVGERLPGKEDFYPVIMKDVPNKWWFTRRFENGKWFCDKDEIVTHWFDLSELPK